MILISQKLQTNRKHTSFQPPLKIQNPTLFLWYQSYKICSSETSSWCIIMRYFWYWTPNPTHQWKKILWPNPTQPDPWMDPTRVQLCPRRLKAPQAQNDELQRNGPRWCLHEYAWFMHMHESVSSTAMRRRRRQHLTQQEYARRARIPTAMHFFSYPQKASI